MPGLYRLSFASARVILLFFFAFFTLCGQAFLFPAQAQDDPLFTVSGVKVDVSAENALAARTKAFDQAQEQAFKTLAERLLSEDDLKTFKLPPVQTIGTMVRDFEVTEERLSKVQYIGTYTFRFRDRAVREYFSGRNVAYTDVRSKPILILPFYQSNGRTLLWDDNNPWLAAWTRANTFQGIVPIQVPLGDLSDVSDIGDDEALGYDDSKLQAMVNRYKAGEAIIVLAKPQIAAGTLPSSLEINIYRTDRGMPEFVKTVETADADRKDAESIFDAAVRGVRKTFQSDWKSRTAVQQPDQGTNRLQARVRYHSLREWAETQKALNRVPGVSNVKLVSFTPREARVEFTFSGGEDRLRLALSQSDITLTTPQVDFSQQGLTSGHSPLVYDLYLNRPGGASLAQ